MRIASRVIHDSHGEVDKRSVDEAIAELAERQHGVVARAQLVDLGIGPGAIDHRIARRRLHLLHRGVFAVGHTRLTTKGLWMAGVLAGGPRSALSHASAGELWGIYHPRDRIVVVTCARAVRSRPGLRFHRSPLPTDERTTREGIPVTTVSRTLFDLAGTVSPGQFARAANEAEIRHLWDLLSLADLVERHPRRPGAATVRGLIDGAALVSRSELEDFFIAFLDRACLPQPAMNRTLCIGNQWIEVDCIWDEQRLVVELDGYATHRTRRAYEMDRARDRALVAAGWRVIRITWRQLRDEPATLARDLRAVLRAE